MFWTKAFIPTLKEDPADAEIVSHMLMIRAGMMRKLGAGIYTYLPLGWRAIRKVEGIVREEMDRAGAQELLLPILSPAELWRESGRWSEYGKEMMRLKDRNEREFALGPTHEEVITGTVRGEVRSYRELPVCLYQIQTKFRDEVRPRFGVMRGREFTMKDAYSFHRDPASLDDYYKIMHEAYTRIFRRCGLDFRAVLADAGIMGGKVTHEFMVLAASGESVVLSCPAQGCGYAATTDTASGAIPACAVAGDEPLREVHTPGRKTVEEVTAFLKVGPECVIKTLIYEAAGAPVAVLIRGDRDVNEAKLQNALACINIALADEAVIRRTTGAGLGFAGPVGLRGIRVIADHTVKGITGGVTGANKTDYHLTGVREGRDFTVSGYHDLALNREGDGCPRCGAALTAYRGIEVGQIFKLGTKYSESMQAVFTDEDGAAKPFVMGCYGIGITRTVAAAIEQHHDRDGIIWPLSIAPYHVEIIPMNVGDEATMKVATDLYAALGQRGVETLLDDRDERPGVKFKDADLVGIPYRVVIGPKGLAQGKVELKSRGSKETQLLALEGAAEEIALMVRTALDKLAG
ncbi:MAG: proline--tRNA ligase [Candidatus Aureabacteria bacterium]|nr:proline--tRNA ligase [Candidatus Auribacterota bacterium]